MARKSKEKKDLEIKEESGILHEDHPAEEVIEEVHEDHPAEEVIEEVHEEPTVEEEESDVLHEEHPAEEVIEEVHEEPTVEEEESDVLHEDHPAEEVIEEVHEEPAVEEEESDVLHEDHPAEEVIEEVHEEPIINEFNDDTYFEDGADNQNSDEYDSLKNKLLQEYTEKKVDAENNDEEETVPLENEVPKDYSNEFESMPYEEQVEIEDDLDINAVNSEDPNLATEGLQSDFDEINNADSPDVDQGFSKVAISSKSSLAMMVIAALVLIFILYKVLQPDESETANKEPELDSSIPIFKPVEDTGQTITVPEIPKLPTAPVLQDPTPPPAPAPPPVSDISISAPQINSIEMPAQKQDVVSNNAFKKSNPEDLARKKARLSSSMITGNVSTIKSNLNKDGQSLSILKRNNNQIVATTIGDLRRVIAEGKMIDAILETAINTDIPGSVRAVVSRNIYSEAGTNILISRGSRLVGNYSSDITFGINRTKVSWTRLIRPDGVDINIASQGTDQLGRAGTSGDLDNHFMRSLSAAVMSSVIDIAVAAYADKQAPITTTTSTIAADTVEAPVTNPDGTTTVVGTATTGSTVTEGDTPTRQSLAYSAAAQNVGETGKDYLEKTRNISPTLTVDQGTPLKVFVNKDLIFPGKSANLTMVIE